MRSDTINIWDKIIKNPPKDFKDYFMNEKLFLINNINKNQVVLDLGCGTGRTIRIISKKCKKIIGIDNDKNAVKIGKNNISNIKNAEIILDDAESLSFKNRSFDVVFIGLTFVNFGETKNKILTEIKRILKDNGTLLFSVYNENALIERIKSYEKFYSGNYTLKENGKVEFKGGAVSEQFNEKEIRQILKENNFEKIEIIKTKITYLIKAKKE